MLHFYRAPNDRSLLILQGKKFSPQQISSPGKIAVALAVDRGIWQVGAWTMKQ
jgi:hypothetical protein